MIGPFSLSLFTVLALFLPNFLTLIGAFLLSLAWLHWDGLANFKTKTLPNLLVQFEWDPPSPIGPIWMIPTKIHSASLVHFHQESSNFNWETFFEPHPTLLGLFSNIFLTLSGHWMQGHPNSIRSLIKYQLTLIGPII